MKLRISLLCALIVSAVSANLYSKHRIVPYGDTYIYLNDITPETDHHRFDDKKKNKKAQPAVHDEQADLDKLGTESVSAENEEFIKNIQHELGMDNVNLTIRKMSDDAIVLVGRENAFVIGGHDYLFVSEEWFEELTPAERRFLIGHELSHLMMQHTEKKQLAQQSMNMLVDYLLKYIGNSAQKGTWKHYGIEAAKNVGLGTMKMLLLAMLSRGCECEADEVSARKLNSAAGGIALFERMDKTRFNREETSWFLILIRKAISCFASHPQHDERIKFLRSIADQNHG